MALRWDEIDLAGGVIRVERSYDEKGRVHVEPKSRAGRRTVPIVGALRDSLAEHKTREGARAGLVFGSSAETPFVASNLWRRVQRAWKRAGVEPIGLHEARHTSASVLIAAGVNAKAITTYMGHASIRTTYDLYGKLMRGSESAAATPRAPDTGQLAYTRKQAAEAWALASRRSTVALFRRRGQ
jgi:integrase